jgi:hypothetical protein
MSEVVTENFGGYYNNITLLYKFQTNDNCRSIILRHAAAAGASADDDAAAVVAAAAAADAAGCCWLLLAAAGCCWLLAAAAAGRWCCYPQDLKHRKSLDNSNCSTYT